MSEAIVVNFKASGQAESTQDAGQQPVALRPVAPIYQIHKYFSNGKLIDNLRTETENNYFLVMSIPTPQGTLSINPQIPASTIEEAFAMAPVIEAQVIEQLKSQAVRQSLLTP
jgi:hypothetical protein